MEARVPAAEYIRMSTDHQEYSLQNQQLSIRKYAAQHGLEIVRTYADPGRSGLTLREREGLLRLLTDVLSDNAAFKAICVYDVSRWGRFQDSDESAHYEFLCKKAGVPIHYCAEQFSNDETMPTAMFKALKRTMAAEYSRELSARVAVAKRRFAAMGYWQGSAPGYGFRRLAVTASGDRRRVLRTGERKPFMTDRIKLIHGPKEEVMLVRRIFKWLNDGKGRIGVTEIAAQLNAERIPYTDGRIWTHQAVRSILSNPKYLGTNIWGRTAAALHSRPKKEMPKQQWIAVPKAFNAIIDASTFKTAQKILKIRSDLRLRAPQLLRELKRILRKRGRLSEECFGRCNGTYSKSSVVRVFGGLKNAYELAGFKYPRSIFLARENALKTERLRDEIVKRILDMFPNELIGYKLPKAIRRRCLLLDGRFKMFVWVAKYRESSTGDPRWYIQPHCREKDGLTLVCLLKPGNEQVQDYYLYPSLDLHCIQYTFGTDDVLLTKGLKLLDLSVLVDKARETLVQYALPVETFEFRKWMRSTVEDQLARRLQPNRSARKKFSGATES